MWLSVTGVPFRYCVNGPPFDGTVTVPSALIPSVDSFQASSSASEFIPAAGKRAEVKVPIAATPAENLKINTGAGPTDR